jgi:hypothetical protein
LKEPLLHFFALGAVLFVLFGWLNRDAMEAPDEVVVDQARMENLAAQFEQAWQRPPSPEELRGLIDGWVREEIMYREGIALGLDVNDTVVRRRVAQKVEFIADGAMPANPTEEELEEWLVSNMHRYRIEPAYTLEQVYFNPARHGDELRARLSELGPTLGTAATAPDGDATLLPGSLRAARTSEVVRTFGAEFADALADLPAGEWQGPVESVYGLHLVRIEEKVPGREPTLAEVRDAVERDWSAAQSEKLNEAFYQAVKKRYIVRMAGNAAGAVPAPNNR